MSNADLGIGIRAMRGEVDHPVNGLGGPVDSLRGAGRDGAHRTQLSRAGHWQVISGMSPILLGEWAGTPALADWLSQRGVLGRELPEEMAVVLLTQALAQGAEDRTCASAGILRFEPGAIADLPDEVECCYRPRLWAAALRRLELLRQRRGQIDGKVPDLALAQLGRKPLQYSPGYICRFLT